MVDIGDMETEKPRMELANLADEMELKAISEKMVAATVLNVEDAQTHQMRTVRKTAGLVIAFETRDGKSLSQKYSKMSSSALKDALAKLKLKRTEDLQENWYVYKKTDMRMGNPRMIPVRLAAKKV